MHIIGLDLETTGVNTDTAGITEIALVHYKGREKLSEFYIKVNPNKSKIITLGALRVTNKCYPSIRSSEYTEEEAAIAVCNYITSHVFPQSGEKRIKILGHNVAFDIVLLKKLLKDNHIEGWEDLFTSNVMDTATIGNFFREAKTITMDTMSLEKLIQALEIDPQQFKFHSALDDVKATFACYFKMLDKQLQISRAFYGKKDH